jgi:DNA-binding YbaB/EbfC family protein
MKNLGQMMKQVQEMQEKMKAMQESLGDAELQGAAGGGMVQVVLNGHGAARSVSIDPSLLQESEKEVLEDLIVAAINDARAKVDAYAKEQTQEIMGGLQLPPGMNLPFG